MNRLEVDSGARRLEPRARADNRFQDFPFPPRAVEISRVDEVRDALRGRQDPL
ncbi:hypothetical protein [Saccharopolyspora phatthalungensis]|uniref:Uncharacterized protein n=1 Tax=Saccharopolyspora phatthalungensis TaxID=664693 RepID=A0A840QGA6_9PSEU|nr:hypothetical protein [Saccharopolyspora phatthalungensis]MBB5159137.1 hypothetical protein [Saccharopolyspora phatthalungensis]